MKRSPGFATGALGGVLLTVPLIVVLWLGSAAGLPFVPFDVFDWTARVLPGRLITFGIDTMVGLLGAIGAGDISQAAKTAERTIAIVAAIAGGALAGGLLFGGASRLRTDSSGMTDPDGRVVLAGLGLGLVAGIVLALLSASVNLTARTGPLVSAGWIVLAHAGWGALLGWSWSRLARPASTGSGAGSGASVERLDRRRFLIRAGGASATISIVGAYVASRLSTGSGTGSAAAAGTRWSDSNPLPNAGAAVEPVPGTRPELTPVQDHYRIDINTRPPQVSEGDWRLRIGGMVERPATWTLDHLRTALEPRDHFVTLACISNPIAGSLTSTQRWTGAPLSAVLDEVGVQPGATHVRIASVDGFHEVVAINDVMNDDRIMLAYAWDGQPLPVKNGFPLRVWIPDRYGMKQPKWIATIDVIGQAEDGYWVSRGWDREARMNATSVIDAIGVDMMVAEAQPGSAIPIGGIAHAGARGISRVEVRVDQGEWRAAELRDPLSDTTWVLWRFEWPFQEGDHTFTVRCFERDGTPQVAERSPVRPDGATGLHSENAMM